MSNPLSAFDPNAPQFQSQNINLLDGVLHVKGTNNIDNILFEEVAGNLLRVIANLNGTEEQEDFQADSVNSIFVSAGNGDDWVTNHTSIGSTIYGGGGNDTILGGFGDDLVFAGRGQDRAEGRGGDDILRMGSEDDQAYGGDGDDLLIGGFGDDSLFGQNQMDVLLGGDGDDELDGGTGDDFIAGGVGNDYLNGAGGENVLRGNAGDDTIRAVFRRDVVQPGSDAGDQTLMTFFVDNVGDGVDNDFSRGNLTLREAVTLAQDGALIKFTTLFGDGDVSISLTEGAIDLEHNIRIVGESEDRLTINANRLDRVFNVLPNITAMFKDIDITGGEAENGGAFHVQGVLDLRHANVFDNTATLDGGAIYIENLGSTYVRRSTIRDNNAGSDGGGIYNLGSLEVARATISGNDSVTQGGGLHQEAANGQLTIVNSTISENTSNFEAGIHLTAGSFLITNSTIAYNASRISGGAAGLSTRNGTPNGQVNNSILVGNTCFGVNLDLSELIDSSQWFNNIVGRVSTGDVTDGVNGNIVGIAAAEVIDPLADNSGFTYTHALKPLSVAIDAGRNDKALSPLGEPLSVDQNGNPRIVNELVDIGSFEA